MELKIDISEEDFITISRIKNTLDGDLLRINMIKAIQNGKPLPKGHGRLIDAEELDECKEIMTTISHESKYAVRMDDIRSVPTIIEADTEGEE